MVSNSRVPVYRVRRQRYPRPDEAGRRHDRIQGSIGNLSFGAGAVPVTRVLVGGAPGPRELDGFVRFAPLEGRKWYSLGGAACGFDPAELAASLPFAAPGGVRRSALRRELVWALHFRALASGVWPRIPSVDGGFVRIRGGGAKPEVGAIGRTFTCYSQMRRDDA